MFTSRNFKFGALLATFSAIAFLGTAGLSHDAAARDRFSVGGSFGNWGNSLGFGYSTGGGGGWGRHGYHRARSNFSLGLNFMIPLNDPYYYDRPYYDPYYPRWPASRPYGYRPYGYSAYTPYPVGGVVVFPPNVRDRLSTRNRARYYDAYRSAMAAPVGETINWHDGRIQGNVTTMRDGWAGERYCREFQQNIEIDGKVEEAYGVACRTPDGDWQIIPD